MICTMHHFQLACLLCLSVWRSTQVSADVKIPALSPTTHQNPATPPKIVHEPGNSNSFRSNSHVLPAGNPDTSSSSSGNVVVPQPPSPGSKNAALWASRMKRTPTGFTARGIHEDIFDRDFGRFSPVKRTQKRRPEADAAGFYGDTFSGGFGEFETMKRTLPYLTDKTLSTLIKRRPEMGAHGFHGDTFAQGFGEFDTMKRNYPYNNWVDNAVEKRKQEMTKSGFHGDVFSNGFGDFGTM